MTAAITLITLLLQSPSGAEIEERIAAGDYPKAIALLREALGHPAGAPHENAAHRLNLGSVYRSISRPDLAAAELRIALRDAERSGDAALRGRVLLALGLAIQETGSYAEAEARMREAFATGAISRAVAHQNLADLYRIQARYAESEAALRVALEELRQSPDPVAQARVQHSLGELLVQLGKDDQAVKAFEAARADPYGSLEGAALTGLGSIAHRQGAYRKAESYFRSSIDFYENQPMYRKSGRLAAAWINLAEALRATGRAAEALSYCEKATTLLAAQEDSFHYARVLNLKGLTLAALKRLDAAEAAFQRALELTVKHAGAGHPHHALVLVNVGELALSRKRYDEAEGHLRRAIQFYGAPGAELSPHAVTAYVAYAETLRKLKRTKEARIAESLARDVAARLPDRHRVSVFGLQRI